MESNYIFFILPGCPGICRNKSNIIELTNVVCHLKCALFEIYRVKKAIETIMKTSYP